MQFASCLLGLVSISALAGCQRDEARVYHVPKDDSQPEQPAVPATPETAPQENVPPTSATAAPQLTYQLPKGWQEKPLTQMRVASFTASGPDGQTADVSVIPLNVVGRDMELVNLWRSQVQLPPTSDPDAVKQAEPVAIGADQGRLFSFVSQHPMIGKYNQRILVAMETRGTTSWFFRIVGPDEFVASQKDKFIQFLKSVSFADAAPKQAASAPVPQIEDSSSNVTPPTGWQPVPPSQFLLAEFSISGANGTKAEVNVAELDGDGGGLLANVNRWRGQLGLDAIGENDLPKLVQSLDVPGGKAELVDITGVDAKTNSPARLVGVMVAQNGQSWFYKLIGDKQIVSQQKDIFTKFIQTANYANAR